MATKGNDMFAVGSIVRAKRGSKRCRAMVATVGGSSASVQAEKDAPSSLCLLWEPVYPNKIGNHKFLITPKSIQKEAEQDEVTVTVDTVQNLLPFETSDPCSGDRDSETSLAKWKDRGDQLLRLGDASAAASFYEKALFDSSKVSIGGTVIVSVEGFPRIAEVDCSDEDDGTIDVTLVHNGDEATIKQSTILLGLMESDPTSLQERMLLNLARCMLQLADLDAANRPKYLKSTVLATTLAVTLSLFRIEDKEESSLLPTNAQTALTLRCKAYTSLSKWSKAAADAKKLIKSGGNGEGQKLLAGIERKKKIQSKKDKKLAKEICLLVQSVTAANESGTKKESGKSALVSPKKVSSSSPRVTTTGQGNNQQVEASTDSRSITSNVLGISVTYFFVAMVTALVSILISSKATSSISSSST